MKSEVHFKAPPPDPQTEALVGRIDAIIRDATGSTWVMDGGPETATQRTHRETKAISEYGKER